jgi:hypothetical protein
MSRKEAVTFLNLFRRPDSDFASLSHRGASNQKTFVLGAWVLELPLLHRHKAWMAAFAAMTGLL